MKNTLFICAGLLVAAGAHADTITYNSATFTLSDSVSSTGALQQKTDTTSVSVKQFDPSLGTLTGVSLTIDGSELTVTLTSNSGTVNGGGGASDKFLPTGPFIPDNHTEADSACSSGTCDLLTNGAVAGFSVPLPGAFNSAYTGTGTVSEGLELDLTAIVNSGNGNAVASDTWSGTVDVTYTYTPAANATVPEPGSCLLLLTVLGIPGLFWRRNRAVRG